MTSRPRCVAWLIIAVVLSGTANNFTGRIRAETLKEYDGTVASIVDSCVFFVFYSVGLLVQLRFAATRLQLRYIFQSTAWQWLVLAGLCDQCGTLCGFTAQPYLTALMYSLMNQAIILFTVVWSLLLLQTRYIALESVSVIVVICAAVGCVFVAGGTDGENNVSMAVLTAVSTVFPAGAYVMKEVVFSRYGAREDLSIGLVGPESRQLSVFVVQPFVGFIGMLAAVPLALAAAAMSSQDARTTLSEGFRCLLHCEHALSSYVVYSVVNTGFNLAIILLVSNGSALLTFLAMKAIVPCTALLSPLPWPLIGAKPVPPEQWLLLGIILMGIIGFRLGTMQREKRMNPGCCWPLSHRLGSVEAGRVEVPRLG